MIEAIYFLSGCFIGAVIMIVGVWLSQLSVVRHILRDVDNCVPPPPPRPRPKCPDWAGYQPEYKGDSHPPKSE